jgi:predicted nucleic acid-binding protein
VFFAAASVLLLSQDVLEQAVKLRQLRKMTLGDALVAATALVHGLTLVTRNLDDFKWIAGLSLLTLHIRPRIGTNHRAGVEP